MWTYSIERFIYELIGNLYECQLYSRRNKKSRLIICAHMQKYQTRKNDDVSNLLTMDGCQKSMETFVHILEFTPIIII